MELGSGKVAGKVLIVDQNAGPVKILILRDTVIEWCPGDGFDALPRDHPRPDFQSIQYLSRQPPVSQRPILDNSLDNSQGPWTVDHGPGLLEPQLRCFFENDGKIWYVDDIGSGHLVNFIICNKLFIHDSIFLLLAYILLSKVIRCVFSLFQFCV